MVEFTSKGLIVGWSRGDIYWSAEVYSEWIPVTESLPRPNEYVLVHTPNDPEVPIETDYIDESGNWDYSTDISTGESMVTHWMPLPEVPSD